MRLSNQRVESLGHECDGAVRVRVEVRQNLGQNLCKITVSRTGSLSSNDRLNYTPLGQSVSEGPSDEGPGRFVTLNPVGMLGVAACS